VAPLKLREEEQVRVVGYVFPRLSRRGPIEAFSAVKTVKTPRDSHAYPGVAPLKPRSGGRSSAGPGDSHAYPGVAPLKPGKGWTSRGSPCIPTPIQAWPH